MHVVRCDGGRPDDPVLVVVLLDDVTCMGRQYPDWQSSPEQQPPPLHCWNWGRQLWPVLLPCVEVDVPVPEVPVPVVPVPEDDVVVPFPFPLYVFDWLCFTYTSKAIQPGV